MRHVLDSIKKTSSWGSRDAAVSKDAPRRSRRPAAGPTARGLARVKIPWTVPAASS